MKPTFIMVLVPLLLLAALPVQAQVKVISSTLSMGGSFNNTNNSNTHIADSFGQQSITGLDTENNTAVLSGFLMPLKSQLQNNNIDGYNNMLIVNYYPNPIDRFLNIEVTTPSNEPYYVTLYDLNGKRVFKEFRLQDKKNKIDLKNLEAGMYLLNIKAQAKYFSSKIIKN